MTTTDTHTTDPEATEPEPTEEEPQPDPRNAEAAKWRTRLRETEAELEAARAELETYRASDTDRLHDAARQALNDKLSYCARLNDDAQAALLEVLDASKFVTPEGEVDQEAIDAYAAPLQPRQMRRSQLRGWSAGGGDRAGIGGSGGGGWGDLIQGAG